MRPIPREHEVARAAQSAVEQQLAPCIPTRLNQGDDYGLDAFVQHVIPGYPPILTNLLFGLQVKGKTESFTDTHHEDLKVAHLVDWASSQVPTLIAVHSVQSAITRWRMVNDILEELDRTKNEWRSQTTVSIVFSEGHQHHASMLHDWIKLELSNAFDHDGGKSRFHRNFRSVLLTELYHGYAFVGQNFQLAKKRNGTPIADCVTGMQWSKGEVDERSVNATRVLSAALLLFDKVYYPASLSYAAVGALGPQRFERLVVSRRLAPVYLPHSSDLTFVTGNGRVGDLYFMESRDKEVLDRELASIAIKYHLPPYFARIVKRAALPVSFPNSVEAELLEVSKTPYVRDMLGLGLARQQAQEAPWSAERLLRIGNIVKFYSIAEQLHVDVVEFEPGLAQVALARWGSRVRFHRIYQAIDELQSALNAAALPDIGLLSEKIGISKCIEISNSTEGLKFRKWYWEVASEAVASNGALSGEVGKRLRSLTGVDCPLPQEFLVQASQIGSHSEGLATRTGGVEALIRQKLFSADRLRRSLNRHHGKVPKPDEPCPCKSDEMFSNCCGKILT